MGSRPRHRAMNSGPGSAPRARLRTHRVRPLRERALAVGTSALLVVALIQVLPQPAGAATTSAVTLTLDGNTISQYNLGYLQALQPHGAHATFFIQSGTVGSSGNFMSWAQLSTVAAAGNDIGGKSVNATNLTTDPNPTSQVCNDRSAILAHGLTPVGFAYPGGANNATVQTIVKNCQYGSARTVGGLSPTGQTWAETMPPANWLATRAYAPSAVTLANMQALVNGSASHGGGWSQIVIGKVCSQSLDATNYTACGASSGHIELADLNLFLDWMANAGQPGGAPAGATMGTVGTAVAARTPLHRRLRSAATTRPARVRPTPASSPSRLRRPTSASAWRARTSRSTAPTRRCPARPTRVRLASTAATVRPPSSSVPGTWRTSSPSRRR